MSKDYGRFVTTGGLKGNVRCITITDNISEHWDSLIGIAKASYEFYAYIFHDSDVDADDKPVPKHIHLLCIDHGGTSLKRHCERFSSVVEKNFVEKVSSPRAMARYLIHLDQPDKFQYDRKLVFTNSPDRYAHYLLDLQDDVVQEFRDFSELYEGKTTVFDFLDKYRGEFSTMPFYQKTAFFHKILTSSASMSLSPPHKTPGGSSKNIINLNERSSHGTTRKTFNIEEDR